MKALRVIKFIIKFIIIAFACAAIVYIVVLLAAFKYSEEQTDSAIYNNLSLKTGQNVKDLSVTTLVDKEQHDVRVIVFQYNGTDGVETGTAIFSKLPLVPRYRFDEMFLGHNSKEIFTVIDTGLTKELTLVNGTDITISTAALGTASRSLILFTVGYLGYLLIQTLRMKEKHVPSKDADSLDE